MIQLKQTLYGVLFLHLISCAGSKKSYNTAHNADKKLNTSGISTVSATESKAQYSFIKAESFYLNQEYDKALIMFDDVLQINPDQAAAYYKKANCYDKKRELASAVSNANLAVEKSPKNEDYTIYLVALYKRTDNLQQAIFAYQNLIDNTKNGRCYLPQSDLYTQMANVEMAKRTQLLDLKDENSIEERMACEQRAFKFFQASIESLNRYEAVVGRLEEILKTKQQLHLLLKEYKEAYTEGEKLVELMPRMLQYQFKQAEILAEYKNLNESISYMHQVIEKNPSSATAHLILADFYKRNSQYVFYQNELNATFSMPEVDLDQKVKLVNQMLSQSKNTATKNTALEMAQKIVETHPKAPQSHSILGDAYLVNGLDEKARNSFVKALNLDPEKSQIWNEVLKIDEELKQTDSLKKHAVKALSVFPEEHIYYLYLANVLSLQNEYLNAQKTLEKGLAQVSGQAGIENDFHIRLAEVYAKQKQYIQSYKYYEKAMEFDPNNALIVNKYSYYLVIGDGNLEQAKAMMSRVVRLFPNELNFADTYGYILYKKGEFQEAFVYLSKAATNGDGITLEHAGDAAFKTNQLDLALEYWTKAQKTGAASTAIQKKINEKKIP